MENEDIDVINIYDRVELFYYENEDAEDIISRKKLERYFRQCAWQGKTDDDLQELWPVIELTLLYMLEKEIENFEQLNMYDYQLMLYLAAQGSLGDNVYLLTEENVKYYAAEMKAFYKYLLNGYIDEDDRLSFMLQEFVNSVYVQGKFDYPEVDENDQFFDTLLHSEELSSEETNNMNLILEKLLNKIGDYYKGRKFFNDLNRAMLLFCDPAMSEEDRAEKDFWFSFWDFFMFDYHLIESDMTPVYYYYKYEKRKLTIGDKLILRDLLNADLRVFEVTDVKDGFALCHDLLKDDIFELPAPEIFMSDYHQVIMIGHTQRSGAMLLNYLTQFPASPKLRQRIKKEIEYYLAMYRCQRPKATMVDFLKRHAAAVRHIILIYCTRAQLGITPVRQLPKPIRNRNRNILSHADRKELYDLWLKMGMSRYSCHLAWDLYCDAVNFNGIGVWDATAPEVLCATAILFSRINGIVYLNDSDIYKAFRVKKDNVETIIDWITETLNLTVSDPRYLIEEGFVGELYAEK